MRSYVSLILMFATCTSFTSVYAADPVNITAELPYVDVIHQGKTVRIQRNQESGNIIDLDYALTSRPCPPYCIQPMKITDGIETIAELELLHYLQKLSSGSEHVLVIDSREEHWLKKGMIPGAVNIPWTRLYNKTSKNKDIADLLSLQFGAVYEDGLWNFQNAKTLVLYCNGPWCGQSPTNIRALLALGYPADKIKWYRGGIQAWKSFGLTTVTPQ
jgi:rhodanese-related sulfurtransferase